MDLLFRKGVLWHLENPPGYGPDLIVNGNYYNLYLQNPYIENYLQ